MNIPNLPNIQTPLVEKDRTMNSYWYLFFTQLNQELQSNVSQEGINIPAQTTSNIAKIQNGSPSPSIIANKETGDFYLSVNGVFKKITVS